MAARGGGYGGRRKTGSSVRIQPQNGGKATYVDRRVIDQMKDATNATEEDIQITLRECGGDVNEATARLIDSKLFSRGCRAGGESGGGDAGARADSRLLA